jgi:hypothetical protein
MAVRQLRVKLEDTAGGGGEYLKGKINGLERDSKNKNIRIV